MSERDPAPSGAPSGSDPPDSPSGPDPSSDEENGLREHAPVGIKDTHKLRLRIMTGIVAVIVVLAAVYLGDVGVTISLLVAGTFATTELFNLFEAKGYHPARYLGIVSGLAIMVLTLFSGTRFHGSFLTAVFVLSFLFLIVRGAPWFPYWNLIAHFDPKAAAEGHRGPQMASISDVATTFLGILYTGWLPSFIILLRKFPQTDPLAPPGASNVSAWGIPYTYPGGAWLTFLFFAAVIMTDVGAYFSGKFLGRRPLIGPLSPRKTVEGAIGGLISATAFATALGLAFHWIFPRFGQVSPLSPWWQCTVLALLVSVTAQISDLSESMIKRDVGRRDAGELIPGHGGMLDRVDSYLLSGAVAYWYVLYFWKIFPWRLHGLP